MLGYILSRTRGDFRILAHRVFRKAAELDRVILPISFDETREAQAVNIETRRLALGYLANGGCIGIFPGGTVSTALEAVRPADGPVLAPLHCAADRQVGRDRNADFLRGPQQPAVPAGEPPALHVRMALLVNEFKIRVGEPVRVVIGRPLDSGELAAFATDARGMMDYLRAETYRLSPTPISDLGYGFEFEDVH